ncbi:MAG TPA: UDP-N-acetylmuramoyl-L-alanine--D-glutamate ligase [Candidatus Excrementavichristensenella intestinipullorum]|nr:UDP-N-acetylmuramoyl-L-alanine--D-glutamate ligase [Candidatus Excrementavichristensenella intestinipullorum]
MNENKLALVVGMARSGVAAALLLAEKGYTLRLADQKGKEQLAQALEPLKGVKGVEYRLGEPAQDLLEGVELVVISPGVPITHPVVKGAQAAGIPCIGELELASRWAKGRLVAITGTNGKTTTSTLTAQIFQNAGKLTHLVGNIGLPYASVALETREEDVTVCEVSSFQLESIRQFRPDYSAILNITPDHLNRHGTMAEYIRLKGRIFENQRGDQPVALNYDDPILRDMAAAAPCRVVWFSRTGRPPQGAFVQDGMIVYGQAGQARPVCPADQVRIPGPHNLENALAATALAMEAGVPAPVIRHTLRTFKGVEHRLETVRQLDGVTYINDSKGTNVDSTLKAIASMTVPTVMIAGGSSKQVDMLPLAQALVGSQVFHVVLCGATSQEIAQALDRAGYRDYSMAGMDFEKAVHMARSLAAPGGNVLLSPACASFDLFKDYEQRGDTFKAIVGALKSGAPD